VAGSADPGFVLRFDDPSDSESKQQVAGGTSAVAPLCAGLLARINQALERPVGFLNSYLYTSVDHGKVFKDITQGSNGAYQAGPGWDACTGFGRVRGQELLEGLRGGPVTGPGG
jgi:kumamolisin